eukprot:11273121-Alexandrium_andersonii.AAC.1
MLRRAVVWPRSSPAPVPTPVVAASALWAAAFSCTFAQPLMCRTSSRTVGLAASVRKFRCSWRLREKPAPMLSHPPPS